MIYLTRDGELFGGATVKDAVADLRRKSRDDEPFAPLERWMQVAAGRAMKQTGHSVCFHTAEEFLADLEAADLIATPTRN